MRGGMLFVAGLALSCSATLAQPAADTLPSKLQGRYTLTVGSGQVFINMFNIVFDAPASPGPVKGRVTWRGVNCGAQDEPFEGTWDGNELRFGMRTYSNVNAQRSNGTCQADPYAIVLKRSPGSATLEGQLVVGQASISMTASP